MQLSVPEHALPGVGRAGGHCTRHCQLPLTQLQVSAPYWQRESAPHAPPDGFDAGHEHSQPSPLQAQVCSPYSQVFAESICMPTPHISLVSQAACVHCQEPFVHKHAAAPWLQANSVFPQAIPDERVFVGQTPQLHALGEKPRQLQVTPPYSQRACPLSVHDAPCDGCASGQSSHSQRRDALHLHVVDA
jgi:hypothetical protein